MNRNRILWACKPYLFYLLKYHSLHYIKTMLANRGCDIDSHAPIHVEDIYIYPERERERGSFLVCLSLVGIACGIRNCNTGVSKMSKSWAKPTLKMPIFLSVPS